MYTTTILSLAFAALAAAAPTASVKRDDSSSTYYGVSLNINVADSFSTPVYEPAPVEINVLTSLGNVSASEISIDPNIASNVDINSIECRAYKDADGVVPGSVPFNVDNPTGLSTNLVEVGSVLCYVVTEAEEA